jgi:hypothetical protein
MLLYQQLKDDAVVYLLQCLSRQVVVVVDLQMAL